MRGQGILSKVYNKPLLITLSEVQPIVDYLSDPTRLTDLKLENVDIPEPIAKEYQTESDYQRAKLIHNNVNPETMTGVLNISGVLVNRKGQLNAQCVELTSYQRLKETFEKQVELGITSCVLMVSSGGGEAYSAWSTAMYVKKLANENSVKLTAYVDGMACSAAYVWTCIADEVVSHPMGQIGSIGVLIQLYNDTKALEKAGYERSFVYAGGNKIPFDKDGAFTEVFLERLQKEVDSTYAKFVKHVVDNTTLSTEEVIATNASVFGAEEALEKRLIDKIMELEDFEVEYGLKESKFKTVQMEQPLQESFMNNEENMSQKPDTGANASENENAIALAQVTEKLEKANAANAQLLAQVEALNKEKADAAHAAMISQREAQLKEFMGADNDQVSAIVANTSALDDTQFATVAQGFKGTFAAVDQAIEEKGGEGAESDQYKASENSFLNNLKAAHAQRTQ